VRVEVGLDVWFCSHEHDLDDIRLRAAFDAPSYGFLADVLSANLSVTVTAERLAAMERGLMRFSHLAVGFARRSARPLAWREAGPKPPVTTTLAWHAAVGLSGRESVVRAYLTPRVPDEQLIRAVNDAMEWVHTEYASRERIGVQSLPSYNLEDGTVSEAALHVA
jgi:hypothetical protein